MKTRGEKIDELRQQIMSRSTIRNDSVLEHLAVLELGRIADILEEMYYLLDNVTTNAGLRG